MASSATDTRNFITEDLGSHGFCSELWRMSNALNHKYTEQYFYNTVKSIFAGFSEEFVLDSLTVIYKNLKQKGERVSATDMLKKSEQVILTKTREQLTPLSFDTSQKVKNEDNEFYLLLLSEYCLQKQQAKIKAK